MAEVPPDHDAWLTAELARLYTVEPTNNPGILLGFPVWGAKFIERFAEFFLPSLLAPRNAEALRAMNAKVVIYTTADDFIHLWRRAWPIEQAGIRLEFGYFPKALTEGNEPGRKYRLLGTVQNALIQRAARSGMGFHMAMPDIVYSERYFEALAGLVGKHEAIANGCLSSNIETIRPEISQHRNGNGLICVSAAALGDMSWRHLHKYMVAAVINGRETPATTLNLLLWRGLGAVHVATPHLNPIWIGPELCRRAPVLAPTSLDAEIPNFMPDGFYIPEIGDDMGMVEISDDTKPVSPAGTMTNFINFCWQQMNFDERYLDVMRRTTRVPIALLLDGMTDAEIEQQHKALIDQLAGQTMPAFAAYMTRNHRRMLRA